MKKILIIILCLWSVAKAQTVGQFRYDTTKFLKVGGYNEVKIQNSTMGVTNGVLTNVDGNGWGKWVAPAAIVANEWHITGNAGTTAANFLGTTDAQSLRFKINNGLAGLLDINGQNTAFGEGSLSAIGIGTGNTAIGTGNSISLSSGSNNTGVGYTNLNSLETGTLNSVFGYGSMTNSVSGSYNTIIGAQSGVDITTGHHNTFVGDSTGFGPTTGSNNTIIGARVTGLSSSIANNIILSDGAGTIRQQFNSSGALSFNGSSFGSSGQILQSNGSAAIPTWVAAATGTVTGTGTANTGTKWTGTSSIGNASFTDDGSTFTIGIPAVGTTSHRVPLLIGGTGTTSTLTYKTTTGVGTTGADHIFQVGNNGATEAMRITNAANVNIGTTLQASPSFLDVGNGATNIMQVGVPTNGAYIRYITSDNYFAAYDTRAHAVAASNVNRGTYVDWTKVGLNSAAFVGFTSASDAAGSPDVTLSRNAAGILQVGTTAANASGSLLVTNLTASSKISVTTGSNKSAGVSGAMTAGTITISTTAVTASSLIYLTHATLGGVQGILSVGTITAGTSFVINSSSAADTGTVNWWLIN